ncbi:kinase-like domain-containing protein [Mycena vulgaris]|nr:kinase-like domain-containing protein [Mycena vulgaris]
MLHDSKTHKQFLACREADAQQLLDFLQDVLDHDGFSLARPFLWKALLRLSRASGLHPKCFPLLGLEKGQQVACGGFSDICKGLVNGQSVSVKIMRLFQDGDVEAVLKEFGREALIWRQLSHPNLLPFFGLYYLENRLCLVAPWMENGNVLEYLKKEAIGIEGRLSLILDVALGLEYLHGKSVVHGDLKAINVLVTPSRRACIADFGLSSIADAMTLRFTHSTASHRGGTTRYQAPELFQEESKNTFDTDVYAFACVCYEILTGKVPFHELRNDMAVMQKVAGGQRPSQPVSCSGTTTLDSLWRLLQDCWREKSNTRPTAIQIVERLVGPLIQAATTRSTTDWDDRFSSKFRRSIEGQPILLSAAQIERMIFGNGWSTFTSLPHTSLLRSFCVTVGVKGTPNRRAEQAKVTDRVHALFLRSPARVPIQHRRPSPGRRPPILCRR